MIEAGRPRRAGRLSLVARVVRATALGAAALLGTTTTCLAVQYVATERAFAALKHDLERNLPVGADDATAADLR